MIPFVKMSAGGNDFILIDNRRGIFNPLPSLIQKTCARKLGVGADGILLLEVSRNVDFKMRIFNPDGTEPEMCGNGARCIARFANLLGIVEKKTIFETKAGFIQAEVSEEMVKIKLEDPKRIELYRRLDLDGEVLTIHFINTGVPHSVLIERDIDKIDVVKLGPQIRYHLDFYPDGTNVTWVKVLDKKTLKIRTYERGVEDETLACGTGACAAACITYLLNLTSPPIDIETRGGEVLKVHFSGSNDKITDLLLEGEVKIIYKGELLL
ncbi:MAG: diaminopimelate epimerase [bacterium]|nr:diaminopimelate epimerase [bacterium]